MTTHTEAGAKTTAQDFGQSIAVPAGTAAKFGVWLSQSEMASAVRVTRYGSTMDAVRAGDLVVDRYLPSLRKLAER